MFRPGKRLRIIGGTLLLLLILLAAWAFLIEPNRLVLRQETIQLKSCPAALNGLRIAVLSDIHAGSAFVDENKLQRIVATTNAQQPDLIVIAGDFVVRTSWHSKHMEPAVIARSLKGLSAPLGVFAVLGNHDWWFSGEGVWRALENEGIRVLENDTAEVQGRGGPFWLIGLSDYWTRPQRIDKVISKVPPGQPAIALTHNPDIFPDIPARVSLTLAGHTHGGQVNFPLLGRIVLPSGDGQRFGAGHIQEGEQHLFVTTGIGTSIFPVRFRVPPEIVVLTITG